MFVVLSPCPQHASGNVGDQLLLETSLRLIEEIHGSTEFDIFWRETDFTSRLEYINDADALLLVGFDIDRNDTRGRHYRIAEDLDAVETPLVPIGGLYRYFPEDEAERSRQIFSRKTKSFLDRVVSNCPEGKIPVRTKLVGEVLQQNGYQTVLTGDPGWYDLDTFGERFHRPKTVDQLVYTTPHKAIYIDQAKELLRRLSAEFPEADRIMSLHNAPTDVDRALYPTARRYNWKIHYASHETDNIEFYRESDLHVGYRKHGHLAHLRLRRPSVVLAEDSRSVGLNDTLETGGVTAFEPRSTNGVDGIVRKSVYTKPVSAAYLLGRNYSGKYAHLLPDRELLKGKPNPFAVDDVLEFIATQRANDWIAYERIREIVERTYEHGMRPYLRSALEPYY